MDFGFLKKVGIDKPWVLFAILAIVVALLVVYFMYSSRSVPVAIEALSGNSAELMFFYTDWCPHCKTAKPVWESLKTTYENQKINGKKNCFYRRKLHRRQTRGRKTDG